MGHKYKLVYFDAPGRAELIRWIFAYGGQEFEDHRIKREDWPSLKATTPFGKLPYLEVDGKALPESVAIARFAARKTGLVGSDDFEAAQAGKNAVKFLIYREILQIRTLQYFSPPNNWPLLEDEF